MSQDLRLKHKCPHRIIEEWLAVEDDRRTLRPVRSPASSQVKILRNRTEIPSNGLFADIEVTGLAIQPYEIERGDNDELKFRIDGGALQTIELPEGPRVRASDVVEAINEQAVDITASVSLGKVSLLVDDEGPQATLKFEGGNGHETLGLPALRFFRGRQVAPGWNLVRDPLSEDPQARIIVFESALRTTDDIFEVSYSTIQGVCRRCMGLGIENDLRHGQNGQPVFVENETLLLQEVEKILFTIKGSNVFHSWYGTRLADLIGSKIVGGGQFLETQLISEISNTLERWKTVKEQQSQLQPVTPREQLQDVVSVQVEQDNQDPTVFRIEIHIRNRAGEINLVEDTIVLADASFAEGFQRIN